jgi:hypothetical protein
MSEHLGAGKVVDSNDFIAFCAKHLAESETADTAEAVNGNFYGHWKIPPEFLNYGYILPQKTLLFK